MLYEDIYAKYFKEIASVLPREVEEGNMEYKLELVDLTEEQVSHRTTQLNW